MTLDDFRAALREAFNAGMEQGREEAISADWGCRASQTSDAAFGDLFEPWNKTDAGVILKCMERIAPKPATEGGNISDRNWTDNLLQHPEN